MNDCSLIFPARSAMRRIIERFRVKRLFIKVIQIMADLNDPLNIIPVLKSFNINIL